MEYKKITYVVECYDNKTEKLIWEREIDNPDLGALHKLFNAPADDLELYSGSFELVGDRVPYFEKLLGGKFDLKKNAYFFSAAGIS
ncbi:MAG: hypothetical protein NDJ72_04495 [Elusimicrobia bacterium]|nr:hypothetical protein [Elusimicrobiota bacterium]